MRGEGAERNNSKILTQSTLHMREEIERLVLLSKELGTFAHCNSKQSNHTKGLTGHTLIVLGAKLQGSEDLSYNLI